MEETSVSDFNEKDEKLKVDLVTLITNVVSGVSDSTLNEAYEKLRGFMTSEEELKELEMFFKFLQRIASEEFKAAPKEPKVAQKELKIALDSLGVRNEFQRQLLDLVKRNLDGIYDPDMHKSRDKYEELCKFTESKGEFQALRVILEFVDKIESRQEAVTTLEVMMASEEFQDI